jgi:hypothetical protein
MSDLKGRLANGAMFLAATGSAVALGLLIGAVVHALFLPQAERSAVLGAGGGLGLYLGLWWSLIVGRRWTREDEASNQLVQTEPYPEWEPANGHAERSTGRVPQRAGR